MSNDQKLIKIDIIKLNHWLNTRKITIQFIKDNRQYIITALATEDKLKKMRKDITLLVESIKF